MTYVAKVVEFVIVYAANHVFLRISFAVVRGRQEWQRVRRVSGFSPETRS